MSNALTKTDLACLLFNEVGLNKRESREVIDSFFDEMKEALAAGKNIKISGFGNFVLRHKSNRPGRNPRTGEAVEVSERTVVTFRAGQKFRKDIDNALRQQQRHKHK